MEFLLPNGQSLWLSTDDLYEEEDLFGWLLDLSRVPFSAGTSDRSCATWHTKSLVRADELQEHDPWQETPRLSRRLEVARGRLLEESGAQHGGKSSRSSHEVRRERCGHAPSRNRLHSMCRIA